MSFVILITAITIIATVNGKQGYGPGEQDWGYVDVREGAHIFYWLYYTTAKVSHYTERPLVIWLQGGPGVSSTGLGNFEELGPLDLYGNYRNHTWVKDMNVLFIDSPVGTGFSYVDNLTQLTSTNKEIAMDLLKFIREFYNVHPEFVDVPLHIFGESYGGKVAPEFALELHKATVRGELRSNLRSVNLVSPAVSLKDSVLAFAPVLLNMGIVDEAGYEKVMVEATKAIQLINDEKWTEANTQVSKVITVINKESKGLNSLNILQPTRINSSDSDESHERTENLMRGPVTKALNIRANVEWGAQRRQTHIYLNGDIMKPVTHIVAELLNHTDIQVSVISGQLDLKCGPVGAINWVAKMPWNYKSDYIAAPRVGINVNGILEGYEKSAGNFNMFWIVRSGHMVPSDNTAGMDYILRKITKYDQVNK